MKTTLELPDPLLRRAKILAAQRGTTLKELVVDGLRWVTGEAPATGAIGLTPSEAAIATIGAHGLPVLKRPAAAKTTTVTLAQVDRLRDELGL